MSKRPLNPRRAALAALRDLSSGLRVMLAMWDQRQTTFERSSAGSSSKRRPLRTDEKMENQAEQWDRLANWCGWAARKLMDLGQLAEKMALRVRAGERW